MRQALRLLALMVVALVSLQLYFVARIALMRWVDPQSTTFQRSEWWRLTREHGPRIAWSQQWVDNGQIADSLKRAVVASEDAGFVDHSGVEWDSIERAWERNQRAQTVQEGRPAKPGAKPRPIKLVGGSTITQQLAKNLFLSGERTLPRKAQEFVLTWTLEALLGKRRILEIYLNSVEWGEGVFGAEAAAQHYFRKSAAQLTAYEAARLAVMLPRPKYFEKLPNSGYLASRASVITGRMRDAELP